MWPAAVRAVASDLDGTLLGPGGSLDGRTRAALAAARAAGVVVVLCTARPVRWVRALADLAEVAVCANGAVTWSLSDDVLLDGTPLPSPAARTLVERVEAALPGGAWAVEYVDRFAHEPTYVPRWPVPDETLVADVRSLLAQPPVKLLLRHDRWTADELLARVAPLGAGLAEVTHSNAADSLLEISARQATKGGALARLCADRGIESCDVIAFGDAPNDLSMLRWAGHAVAVANAHPDVVAAADEVTAAHDRFGVARVLERLGASTVTGPVRVPR